MTGRRAFLALAAASCACMMARAAQGADSWRPGQHYMLVENQQAPSVVGKVEINEFFWYACGHCYSLDPVLEDWNGRKAAYIQFVRTPVVWGGPGERQFAKLYYTLLALRRPELHAKVFAAIHQQGVVLTGPDDTKVRARHADFLSAFGIAPAQFDAAYDSMMVAVNVQRAEKATMDLKVANVPTLVINGKFATRVDLAGGEAQLLSLLDDLAAGEKH
jgi:protein dithiol oxidoreductase (disulfide-forming)